VVSPGAWRGCCSACWRGREEPPRESPARARGVQPGSRSAPSAPRRDVPQGLPLAPAVVPRKGGGARRRQRALLGAAGRAAARAVEPREGWSGAGSPASARCGGQEAGWDSGVVAGGSPRGLSLPGAMSRLGKLRCARIPGPSPSAWPWPEGLWAGGSGRLEVS